MEMKLSFTTLACPAWPWQEILDRAAATGYGGVEVRGILGEMDNGKLPPFRDENIAGTRSALSSRGLCIPCLDTSCTLLSPSAEETMRDAKASIDIAGKLGMPFIRVFGDRIPGGMREEDAVAAVSGGLQALAEYAEGKGVAVLLETHGDFAGSRLALAVFDRVKSPAAGLLWDIANPYAFGETVETTWARLGRLVRHTHIKDVGEGMVPCLPGRGRVPVGEAVRLLRDAGYGGWLSFEWEKQWHPDIEAPEIALPHFMDYMGRFL